MSYVTVWLHCVWSTKNREPVLTKELRPELFQHIFDNGRRKRIWVDTVNGYQEHVHTLISLDKSMSIAKALQLMKGESANWLNKHPLVKEKIHWQDDYFVVSVGQSQVEKVRNYIRNQEQHHSHKSYEQEVNEFMEKYEWAKFKDGV
jgi:putative transposase